jgi:hypothetical protein
MIRAGDTIENPITGERVTFLATSVVKPGKAFVKLGSCRVYR